MPANVGIQGDGQRLSYRWKTVSRTWGLDPGFHRGDEIAWIPAGFILSVVEGPE
jgi:hypothetical protein